MSASVFLGVVQIRGVLGSEVMMCAICEGSSMVVLVLRSYSSHLVSPISSNQTGGSWEVSGWGIL